MRKIICTLLSLLLLFGAVPGVGEESHRFVQYTTPGNRPAERLTDTDPMTRITVDRSDRITLTLDLPAQEADRLYLVWYTLPQQATLLQYNADGERISNLSLSEPDSAYLSIPLEAGSTRIELYADAPYTLSTMFVSDVAPDPAYGFLEPASKTCDLMLLLPQPITETERLSGLLATYAIEHAVDTAVVFLCSGTAEELWESHRSLQALGVQNEPISLNCVDHAYNQLADVQRTWDGHGAEQKLQSVIETMQPKVIVCLGAEETDARATYTNILLRAVLQQSAFRPEKVYETDPDGTTVLDFTEPLLAYGGESAQRVTQAAYRLCKSRGVYRRTLADKLTLNRIDSVLYAEAEATADALESTPKSAAESDLLTGIDLSSLHSYAAATPTPEPTATPTAEPTATPTVEATTTPSEATATPSEPTTASTAPAAEPTDAPKRGLFSCGAKEISAEPTPTQAATPTVPPTATPAPTAPTADPTATPAPTAEPTPSPTPISEFDAHFVNDGSGEEIVSVDTERGEWVYRSDILAVEITRHAVTILRNEREEPCVYFVAQIYQREYDSFRPTFGSAMHDGRSRRSAQEMSDEAKCVLWITGDNIINSDEEMKSILIRGGYMFRQATNADCLVLDSETLSMHIVRANSISARDLYESGVQNSFSFGPTMIENGEQIENARKQRRTLNPRTALGMIEPGHFVAVVVDGRQEGYSNGMEMWELMDLMSSLGCQVAYNLDGGMSATMMFLGTKINRHGEGIDSMSGNPSTQRYMPDGLTWGYSERWYGTDFGKAD